MGSCSPLPRRQSRACPHPGLALIQVYDNKFTTRWDRTTDVNATIGGDGTIQGGAENISLTGKLDGTKMTFDVTNGDCGLHFTVTRPSPSDAGGAPH